MNGKERKTLDELLPIISRLDERSINTWRTIEDIKKMLEGQNGRIRRNSKLIYIIMGALSASGISFGVVSWVG